jgi:dihydrofolate reductase
VREVTVDEFVSLEGFAAGASGEPDFALGDDGPEFAKFQMRVINEPQVIVLGRNTYENMSRWFPSAPGPFAAAMNGLPKLVFSHTLSEPLSWSNARVARDPAAEITALKQEAGLHRQPDAGPGNDGARTGGPAPTGRLSAHPRQ